MGFRTGFMHGVCPVCTKHKLLLKELVHNFQARNKQRLLYDKHLRNQYEDRKWYWFLKAQSRLHVPLICIILDGMDQAKFAWPRAPFIHTHMFDGFQRPKLHIWGALCHGYMAMLTISHADVHKGGSTTVEVLAHILTLLAQRLGDLSRYHIHVQLDNTASANKNNTLLAFLGFLAATGKVFTATANFLRIGHTHEDVDQFFGRLARWIRKRLPVAATVADFIRSLQAFLDQTHLPSEPLRLVRRLERIRNWKGWFKKLEKPVSGIAGQGAPHSFTCSRRAALPVTHSMRQAVFIFWKSVKLSKLK